MPHSTTGTTSYVLVKYSRAYPTKRITQNTQSSSELAAEWQHFTNPTLHLLLDVTRSSKENLESVRLRILWQINNEQDTGYNNQPDVVFEDLDLLSFSLDMVSSNSRKHAVEGLPLKAVYRDTVVGIRYLHPRDASGEFATYRRFQISFQSAVEASEFINTIKPVCPCKLNPTPVPPNLGLQPPITRPVNLTSAVPMQATRNPMARTDQLPFVHSITASQQSHQLPPVGPPEISNCLQPIMHPSTSYFLSSSPPRHSNADNYSVTNSNPPTQPTEITYQVPSQNQSVVHRNHESTFGNSAGQANFPGSSLSIPSSDSIYGPTQRPGADTHAIAQESGQSILASLRDATTIYNLSTSSLERVVAEVIREEGFLQLVERLAEMFTVRKVANV